MEVGYSIWYDSGGSVRLQAEIWHSTGYLSQSGQLCAAGVQAGKGRSQDHSGISNWSSKMAACS